MKRFLHGRRAATARAGFTLIELLVVIGVIMVLLTLGLPALRNARSSAKKAACLSNLHQIHLASFSYAGDHAGRFPWRTSWNSYPQQYTSVFFTNSLLPYLSSREKLMFCPGELVQARNLAVGAYDDVFITYQYFNLPIDAGAAAANWISPMARPDLSQSTAKPGCPLWGCLTVDKGSGRLGHNEPWSRAPFSGMNAVSVGGSARWVPGGQLQGFWRLSGVGTFYWPEPGTL